MRSTPIPSIRVALIATSGISIGVALISFALAFTVDSPARSLRPLIPAVDSMYTPVYLSMTAAGLLLLAGVIAIVSSLHGNRAVDVASCATFLAVIVLSLVSLALAASIKGNIESKLEVTLRSTLAGYGPVNVTIFKVWNDMQSDLKCCAVRTNTAQDNYLVTPWYRQIREGSAYSTPKIPNTCCSSQLTATQMTDCTTNLVSLPAQNKYMNPIGCFEAVQQMTDAFTNRYIIISVLLFAVSGITFGLAVYHLICLSRLSASNASAPEGQKQLCSGGGKNQHLEFAYANHAAALSLSKTSLASGSTLQSSSTRIHSKSPSASVYNGSSHRSPTRLASTAQLDEGTRQNSAFRTSNSAKLSVPSSACSSIAAPSNPPSPPITKDSSTGTNKVLQNSTPAASSTLPVTVALKAQPIRSGIRDGKQLANQRSGSMPPPNQRTVSPPAANHKKAKSPPANQSSTMPTNQKMRASPAEANHKVGGHAPTAANQRATMPPPSTNQNAERQASPTLAHRANSTVASSGGADRQTTVLKTDGKRESNF